MKTYSAVLFDLDGTLLDTAPDLAAAANKMRMDRQLPIIALEKLRPLSSSGARGFIEFCFQVDAEDPRFEALKREFLNNYEANLCTHSRFFPGMSDLLHDLTQRQIAWGIVTNKIHRFTEPLTQHFGLNQRTSCIVSGDSTAYTKPHPTPLLHAAQILQVPSHQTIYVGDDLRDIQAGRAANMATIAATYGYCGKTAAPETWQADYLVQNIHALHTLLQQLTL